MNLPRRGHRAAHSRYLRTHLTPIEGYGYQSRPVLSASTIELTMLLRHETGVRATLLAAHVTDFGSVGKAWRWRRRARRELPHAPGLIFAKAMPFIGSGQSAGFGAGLPALGRQVLLTAWCNETDFRLFLEEPIAQRLNLEAKHSSWSLF